MEPVPNETSFYLRNLGNGAYLTHQTSSSFGQPWKLLLGSRGGQNSKWRFPDDVAGAVAEQKTLRDIINNPKATGVFLVSKSYYGKAHTMDIENENIIDGGKVIMYEWKPTEQKANQLFVVERNVIRVRNKSLYLAVNGNKEVYLTSDVNSAAKWSFEQNKSKGFFKIRNLDGSGYLGHETNGSGYWSCKVAHSGLHFDWTDGVLISNRIYNELKRYGLAPDSPMTVEGGLTGRMPFASVVAAGGGNVVAAGGANVVAAGGGNVVAAGGGNVIAAGGGNVVAAGGLN
jgi:hypothetical protein